MQIKKEIENEKIIDDDDDDDDVNIDDTTNKGCYDRVLRRFDAFEFGATHENDESDKYRLTPFSIERKGKYEFFFR